jgi:hypothetical protein
MYICTYKYHWVTLADQYTACSVLLELIRSSNNPQVLAIACYDLGEFVRFHPRGRKYAPPPPPPPPPPHTHTHTFKFRD